MVIAAFVVSIASLVVAAVAIRLSYTSDKALQESADVAISSTLQTLRGLSQPPSERVARGMAGERTWHLIADPRRVRPGEEVFIFASVHADDDQPLTSHPRWSSLMFYVTSPSGKISFEVRSADRQDNPPGYSWNIRYPIEFPGNATSDEIGVYTIELLAPDDKYPRLIEGFVVLK